MYNRNRNHWSGRRLPKCLLVLVLFFCLISLLNPGIVRASGNTISSLLREQTEIVSKENPETGFTAEILDNAGLLTDSEKKELLEEMYPLTDYGNAAFQSTNVNTTTPREFIDRYYAGYTGSIFLLDMDNRQVGLYNSGAIYDVVTTSHTATITDNIYRYATKGNYYACAAEAFREETALLKGQRIAQPMKIICSILLALILGFMINFLILSHQRKPAKVPYEPLLSKLAQSVMTRSLHVNVYKRVEHDSDSGGGGFGGGGGGGGGGFSGGGSSHGF